MLNYLFYFLNNINCLKIHVLCNNIFPVKIQNITINITTHHYTLRLSIFGSSGMFWFFCSLIHRTSLTLFILIIRKSFRWDLPDEDADSFYKLWQYNNQNIISYIMNILNTYKHVNYIFY